MQTLTQAKHRRLSRWKVSVISIAVLILIFGGVNKLSYSFKPNFYGVGSIRVFERYHMLSFLNISSPGDSGWRRGSVKFCSNEGITLFGFTSSRASYDGNPNQWIVYQYVNAPRDYLVKIPSGLYISIINGGSGSLVIGKSKPPAVEDYKYLKEFAFEFAEASQN